VPPHLIIAPPLLAAGEPAASASSHSLPLSAAPHQDNAVRWCDRERVPQQR